MIKDSQTNFVYLSDKLAGTYPNFARELISLFKIHEIDFGFLPNTKDTWAVDFMPIQVSLQKFVRFTYKPDYLVSTKKWSKTISNVDEICENIGIKTIKSDIILDGGNISKWDDKVLMTNKVFIENSNIPELELIERFKDLLETDEIFFVPVEKGDWLGHVDGMARFVNQSTVLINDTRREKIEDYIDFLMALRNAGLNWIEFPFNIYENESVDDAAGLYLNYLEMEKLVVLPVFDFDSDDLAIEAANKIFKGRKIITIKSNEPAKDTGIINCLTWNIRK